jgi:hypothetical protein
VINVEEVITATPHCETFCSVQKLNTLVERLYSEPRFDIVVAGTSANGVPIYHVRFGKGSVKALLVAGLHCHEPIGGLTVFSLITLLQQGNRALTQADVEWNIVPCIDPDGALLNEGWTQKAFTLQNYLRHFYLQFRPDKVDGAFPIKYKKLIFDQPTQEAKILQGILDKVRPDFYFLLHNAYLGGAINFLTRPIGAQYYREMQSLLERHRIPIQLSTPHGEELCPAVADGIFIWPKTFTQKFYDHLERTGSSPEGILRGNGATSVDYLAQIKHDALTFASEIPYLRYSDERFKEEIQGSLRQLKLRVDADNKLLATVLFEEWENVRNDINHSSPFYRAIIDDIGSARERLLEEAPFSMLPTRAILFDPQYSRRATEGDRFNVYVYDRFQFLRRNYEFVRLLRASEQTASVKRAIARLDAEFDDAMDDLASHVNFDAFEVIDCDTLAKAQLGGGLIALNSVLEAQHATSNALA